jgi:hypothetical protein
MFTKPLKDDVFIKMRDLLGVTKKSSLRRMLEVNQISKELIGLVEQLGIDQLIKTKQLDWII